MKKTADPLGFEALDRCHVQIHEHLAKLAAMARQIAVSGIDPESYFVTQLFTRLEQDMTPQLASVMFNLNITF